MKLVTRPEAIEILGVEDKKQCALYLDLLLESHVITCIDQGEQIFVVEQLGPAKEIINRWILNPPNRFYNADLFSCGQLAAVELSDGTVLKLKNPQSEVESAYYSGVQNLVNAAKAFKRNSNLPEMHYFGDAVLENPCREMQTTCSIQIDRSAVVENRKASQFANSAYYMGSKKNLSGFLVEAISSVLPSEGQVLDLMCGSGAAASAFSSIWRTSASDAMEFCQALAVVQGGGFTGADGVSLLKELLPIAREHADQLATVVRSQLDSEDRLFHSELDDQLKDDYQEFLESTLLFPQKGKRGNWDPYHEVADRQKDPSALPFCLFTAYFANVYFGFRQCVEIDSLRFAIESIEDPMRRRFALGVLIASCSALSTTYAGHFAQPVIRDPSSLTLFKIRTVIERRARSIFHEFDVRARELSRESERTKYAIDIVPGPWQTALRQWKRRLSGQGFVYIDAPYKREEYSRYYHVLETLMKYNYPGSTGRGRLPNRSNGEMFQSEFFTRSKDRLERELSLVLLAALESGFTCGWSYSSTGHANISNVLKLVGEERSIDVALHSAPFTYSGQGGQPSQRVCEYLLLIR